MGIPASTYNAPTVFVGPHTQYPNFSAEPTGSIYVKTTTPNSGANWTVKQWSATSNAFNTVRAPIYADTASATFNLDKTGGGANIPVGTLCIESNFTHGDDTTTDSPILANFKILRRTAVAPTTITSSDSTAGSVGAGGRSRVEQGPVPQRRGTRLEPPPLQRTPGRDAPRAETGRSRFGLRAQPEQPTHDADRQQLSVRRRCGAT